MHHAHAPSASGARTQMRRTKHAMNAAMSSGAMQYPKTQRPWKNDLWRHNKYFNLILIRSQEGEAYTLPPRSLAWMVTTREPIETMTTTLVNTARE